MNKLYIYGDSFSADYEGEDWIWTRQLGHIMHSLNMIDAVHNTSQAGAANDWLFHHIREDYDAWQAGDYIIVIPTETARQWWFEHKPDMSNIMSIRGSIEAQELAKTHQREMDAVDMYYTFLWRKEIDLLRFEQSLVWLKTLALQKNCELVIIPAFDIPMDYTGIVPTIGSLTETVCNGEFKTKADMDRWYSVGVDTRNNHMMKKNHAVLVQKLVDRFVQGTPVDLTHGFALQELEFKDRLSLDDQLGTWLLNKARRAVRL